MVVHTNHPPGTLQAAGIAGPSPSSRRLRGPIRTFPFGAPAAARRLQATLQAEAARHYRPVPLPTRPAAPYVRKPLLEELEPRLLLSADLNPAAHDTLFAAPAIQGAEFRSLTDAGRPAAVTELPAVFRLPGADG